MRPIDSPFGPLHNTTLFCKLDLRNACHLVRICEGNKWQTAFTTNLGHFEYLALSSGLTNAPAVFQALINNVLRDMLDKFVFVYLDDSVYLDDFFPIILRYMCYMLNKCCKDFLRNKL